jgi:hypothetical protein
MSIESSKDIKKSQYEGICTWIEEEGQRIKEQA